METKLNVKLLSHTLNPELVIATAGKLCYSPSDINDLMNGLDEEKIAKFVNMLVSMGHESPLEHAVFNFAIEGVSRSLTHQLVRHRLASYSQQSQRYVREAQFEYVIPEDIKDDELLKKLYIEHMEQSQRVYDSIVDKLILNYLTLPKYADYLNRQLKKFKIDKDEFNMCLHVSDKIENVRIKYKTLYSAIEKKAIENARYIFPNATETKIIATMNLRTLINFCHHRCCTRAQEEIHQLAWGISDIMDQNFPLLGRCLGANCQFGVCPEGSMSCGKIYPKKR